MNIPKQPAPSSMSQELPMVRPIRAEEVVWIEPPQHYGAYSKLLVNPDNSSSRHFDFRLSLYQPKSYVGDHVHERSEHVYYILQGRGLMKLDSVQYVVEPNTAIFIPPGVVHSLANTGLENLLFIVVTVPAGELPRIDSSEREQAIVVKSDSRNEEITKS
jgi:mannose-6-phosphate isomerase-like protein (cupin superfamily)